MREKQLSGGGGESGGRVEGRVEEGGREKRGSVGGGRGLLSKRGSYMP